ncbi:MAG: hypothetical protein ACRELS_01270 [Candidatus Rokuibacteriota bacterium]
MPLVPYLRWLGIGAVAVIAVWVLTRRVRSRPARLALRCLAVAAWLALAAASPFLAYFAFGGPIAVWGLTSLAATRALSWATWLLAAVLALAMLLWTLAFGGAGWSRLPPSGS